MAVSVTFTGWTIKPFRHSVKLVPQCLMASVLARTSARLLASSPNYLEATPSFPLSPRQDSSSNRFSGPSVQACASQLQQLRHSSFTPA
jgi:hypothetical protein